jgi:triacylglycerol lipase
MSIDVNKAIELGQLINAAYAISPLDLTQRAGKFIEPQYDPLGWNLEIIATIYGNDLIANSDSPIAKVSYGLVMQDQQGNVVVAFRGTQRILEWIQDAAIFQMPCPFQFGCGHTETGFTVVYQTLNVSFYLASSLAKSIAALPYSRPVCSFTICGHSLGAALATLLALDIAGNTQFWPTVYTFGSPRIGDPVFANRYELLVPETYRIANLLDIVPQLPLEHPFQPLPQYRHVGKLIALNTFSQSEHVIPSLRCEHVLSTYLFLLAGQPGLTIPPVSLPRLDPTCRIQFN